MNEAAATCEASITSGALCAQHASATRTRSRSDASVSAEVQMCCLRQEISPERSTHLRDFGRLKTKHRSSQHEFRCSFPGHRLEFVASNVAFVASRSPSPVLETRTYASLCWGRGPNGKNSEQNFRLPACLADSSSCELVE